MNTRRHSSLRTIAAILLTIVCAATAARAEKIDLKVMTFNLRYASPKPPHSWPERRPILKAAVRKSDPDFFGTQEGLYAQLKDIAQDLDDYQWLGEGRRGGSKDEFMAIFYKKDRLEPMAFGHFWLSDTPDVIGSANWGNTLPRMVTWIRFWEKKSGLEFFHFNTHFDHQSQPAREKSIELLGKRVGERIPAIPVIVTGDFNLPQTSPTHDALMKATGLSDAWDTAAEREGTQIGTFHNFNGEHPGTDRIDWILLSPEFRSRRAEVITYHKDAEYPSDHFPVLAEVEIEYTAPEVKGN